MLPEATRRPAGVPAVRRLLAALVLALLTAGGLLATAGPAAAHAELVSADPASGSRLDAPPEQLTLTFTESVRLVTGGLRLLDDSGAARQLGDAELDGPEVTVPVAEDLPDGSYVFVYRVISGDTHPVSGALTFAVGDGAAPAAPQEVSAAAADVGGTDPVVRVAGGVNRWVSYAGAILVVGVPAFAMLCWRGGGTDRRLRTLTLTGAALVAATAVAAVPLQAARSTGAGLSDALADGSATDAATSFYGAAVAARLGFLAALLVLLALARRHPAPALAGLAAVAAAAMLLTYSRVGHPAVGEYPVLTMADDALHLGAVAVWLGGLVVLAVRLLPRPPADAAAVLTRWSRTATAAVLVLAVTGTIQAAREIRSVSGVIETSYGRWVLAKVAGLLVLLALAAVARNRLRRYAAAAAADRATPAPVGVSLGAMRAEPPAGPPDAAARDRGFLRRCVGAELAVSAAVLVATAFLVVTPPGDASASSRETAGAGSGHGDHGEHDGGHDAEHDAGHAAAGGDAAGPVAQTVELPNDARAEVIADPAVAGEDGRIEIRTTAPDGDPLEPEEVTATAALPAAGIAPIDLQLRETGPGRYAVEPGATLVPGEWTFTVTVRTSDVDSGVGAVTIALS